MPYDSQQPMVEAGLEIKMKKRSPLTKEELENLDFSQYDKGVKELAESGVSINLDKLRKELLLAFEEKNKSDESRREMLKTLKEVKLEREKLNSAMKEFLKRKSKKGSSATLEIVH